MDDHTRQPFAPVRNGTQVTSATGHQHRVRRRLLAAWGGAFLLGVSFQLTQPDSLAALSLIPVWCWSVGAGLLLLLIDRRWRVRCAGLACAAGFWFGCGEEPAPLLRTLVSTAERGPVVRVVTSNLAGSAAAIDELQGSGADLVFLQEISSSLALDRLAEQLFGANRQVISSPDCAIIGDGLRPLAIDPQGRWVIADWRGTAVASVRLSAPAFRLDFWRPGCWSAYARVRRQHRQEVDELLTALHRVAPGKPLLVGGDFNAPGTDAAWRNLRKVADDAFRVAGQGWPHTGTSELPLFRVDLIWASDSLQPILCYAERTANSDHRRVWAEFAFGAAATD